MFLRRRKWANRDKKQKTPIHHISCHYHRENLNQIYKLTQQFLVVCGVLINNNLWRKGRTVHLQVFDQNRMTGFMLLRLWRFLTRSWGLVLVFLMVNHLLLIVVVVVVFIVIGDDRRKGKVDIIILPTCRKKFLTGDGIRGIIGGRGG